MYKIVHFIIKHYILLNTAQELAHELYQESFLFAALSSLPCVGTGTLVDKLRL